MEKIKMINEKGEIESVDINSLRYCELKQFADNLMFSFLFINANEKQLKEQFAEKDNKIKYSNFVFIIKSINPANQKTQYMAFNSCDSFYRYWTEDIEDATLFSHKTISYLISKNNYDSQDFLRMIEGRKEIKKIYMIPVFEEDYNE